MLRFHVSIVFEASRGCPPVEFDSAFALLSRLDRLFIEPDGSFVWTGVAADGESWQVDGNLIDRGDVLAYVELKGRCPEERFDRLLAIFRSAPEELAFNLVRRGVTISEAEFRKLAATSEGAI